MTPVVNSNGEQFTLNYNIESVGDHGVYVRFKIENNGAITNYQINDANIVKKGDIYYYKKPLDPGENMNIPITFTAITNSGLSEITESFEIKAGAVQSNSYTPDFSADNPWPDVEWEEASTNTKNIIKVSNLKIKDDIKLAYLVDEDMLEIKVTIKPNNMQNTGSSEYWKVQNIYDLAGNVEEWIIDKNNGSYVTRGGKYYEKDGKETPINSSNAVEQNTKTNYIGYRAILYIK